MTPETLSAIRAPGSGGDVRLRRRRTPGASRPTGQCPVAPDSCAGPAPGLAGEATLIGALGLVEEGLAAVEESYRRVLVSLGRALGPHHCEVAAIHRWLAEADYCHGRWAEAEAHVRRAARIVRRLAPS
jgi:hypothetical protein